MALNHNPHQTAFASGQLIADSPDYLGLALWILATVSMTAVNHKASWNAGLGHQRCHSVKTSGIIIRLNTTAKDHVTIIIASSGINSRVPFLGKGQKMVRMLCCSDSIDCNL